MTNNQKATILIILTAVALLWDAAMMFNKMPIVTVSSEDGEKDATISVKFDKIIAEMKGERPKVNKMPGKEKVRLYFGASVRYLMYLLLLIFLLKYILELGNRNHLNAYLASTRIKSLQNVMVFIAIGGIVSTFWGYLTIKGTLQAKDIETAMASGVYIDFAHTLIIGVIGIIRFDYALMEIADLSNAPPPPLPPPPPPPGMLLVAPATLACPKCHLVQTRDSRFCKSCGTPLLNTCKKCKADLELDAKFCPKCGQTTLATCGKCQKPMDPSGKFCEHCGAPNPSAAIPVTAKRKEIFVGSMQYVLNPAETGIEFCAECGEKADKCQMYYNDEVKKYIHHDCLMNLRDDPSDDVIV